MHISKMLSPYLYNFSGCSTIEWYRDNITIITLIINRDMKILLSPIPSGRYISHAKRALLCINTTPQKPQGWKFLGILSEGYLPIPFQKVKCSHIVHFVHTINTVWNIDEMMETIGCRWDLHGLAGNILTGLVKFQYLWKEIEYCRTTSSSQSVVSRVVPAYLCLSQMAHWFCMDFMKLNADTRADSYPLSRIEDLL